METYRTNSPFFLPFMPSGGTFNVQKIGLLSLVSTVCSQQTARVLFLQEDSYAFKTCSSVLQNEVTSLDSKGRMGKHKDGNSIDHYCA